MLTACPNRYLVQLSNHPSFCCCGEGKRLRFWKKNSLEPKQVLLRQRRNVRSYLVRFAGARPERSRARRKKIVLLPGPYTEPQGRASRGRIYSLALVVC